MNKSSSALLPWLAKLCLILLSFLFAEGLLQVSSIWVKKVDQITAHPNKIRGMIDDARLGVRGNPSHPEHDSLGFRNPRKPKTTHIVALGDSQTYGTSVRMNEAWPRILSARLNKDVYNMGLMGGYGPYHNYINLELALPLKPKWVIFGFYFGNDFYDSFALALRNNTLKDFISQARIEKIKRLEISGPLKKKVDVLFGDSQVSGNQRNENYANLPSRFRTWISYNSRLFGLLRTLKAASTSQKKHSCCQKTLITSQKD